jgi:hypothetical protein
MINLLVRLGMDDQMPPLNLKVFLINGMNYSILRQLDSLVHHSATHLIIISTPSMLTSIV